MSIREATRDDIEAIREVARHSWAADPPAVVSRETVTDRVDEWYAPDRLADDIARPRALVLVADEGGVVGFSHAVLSAATGHVLRLYVDPDHRGRGLGGELLTATRDALFDRGAETLQAMVLTENEPGNAFYRAFGFEPVGEAETTIGGEPHPETTYVLERTVESEQSPAN
ncbi:GNAT family N-acetyltransferase [Halorarius litoreus]|uniref:GNAT family N-acetyltransferase n=1 Tax=Halorarius litoreus TaxID=2962676 RepID=UPI0020CE86B1|nr:GNAT family N-acetyltransferase [Halorarius litoreus]